MLLDQCFAGFVNLDHRKDRLEKMVVNLGVAGIDAVRMPGRLPNTFGPDPRWNTMRNRTPGAIGCHYSQVAVMEKALLERKHAFVMEDDLVFCKDFQERLMIIEAFMETHPWDVFWLGGTFHVNPPWWHKRTATDKNLTPSLGRDAERTDHPRILRTYGAFSTHAYIVNVASIPKILDLLERQIAFSIGIDYLFITLQPRLFTYAFVPGCIIQYDNQSDIGKGITKYSGFSKLGPHWFQNKMEDFDPAKYNWNECNQISS